MILAEDLADRLREEVEADWTAWPVRSLAARVAMLAARHASEGQEVAIYIKGRDVQLVAGALDVRQLNVSRSLSWSAVVVSQLKPKIRAMAVDERIADLFDQLRRAYGSPP